MGTISIIEFIVYGLVAYSSLLMLIISVIKDIPTTKAMSIARSIFMIPGMICAGVLAASGVNISWITSNATQITKNLNTTEVWSQTTTQTNNIVLISPVWMMVHFMIFIVLFFFVVQQILYFFTKTE